MTEPEGVWMVYDYDNGPHVLSLWPSAEAAVRAIAGLGYGRVGFFPLGVELREAVRTWESQNAT